MGQIVLADATPLIYLSQIDHGLSWLKSLFGPVDMTSVVRGEVIKEGKLGAAEIDAALRRGDLRELAGDWSEPKFPKLHDGEASTMRAAINLAKSGSTCLVLMDEKDGREQIKRLGSTTIVVSGTAAVIGRAKELGLVVSAVTVFAELQQKGFYIADDIVRGILWGIGEVADAEELSSVPERKPRARKTRKPH